MTEKTTKPEWTEEQRALAVENLALAQWFARRHYRLANELVPLEDLQDAAVEALCKAALAYRAAEKTDGKFSGFAGMCMDRALGDVRRNWRHRRKLWARPLSSVRFRRNGEGGAEVDFEDPRAADPAEHADTRATIDEVLRILPTRVRRVVELRLQGLRSTEVAAKIDFSNTYVRNTEARAIALAKAHFASAAVRGQ